MNDSRSDVERSSRHDLYLETQKTRRPTRADQPIMLVRLRLLSLLPATDGSINQMEPRSIDNGNLRDNDLDPPLDFDSFEMAGPEEGEMEFNYASAWPDWIFLTSV
jgi:hypothetical protein